MPRNKEVILEPSVEPTLQPPRRPSKLFLLLVIVGLGLLLWRYKSAFIVALVNNKPITRWQLNQVLASRYGAQTLDNLVTQSLVESEINRLNIEVSQDEISAKIQEIETTLPQGMTLTQALELQGTTLVDFTNQLQLQLAVNKHLESQVQISDDDITKYLTENKSLLTASSPAEMRKEAEDTIRADKTRELVDKWLADLQAQAKVYKFL